jgi:hypothetical protein
MSEQTTSSTINKIQSVADKLGISLNVLSGVAIIVFLVIFFTLRQITTLKWIVFAIVIALNSGNLIYNVKDAIAAYQNNESTVKNILMSLLSSGGGVIAPILLVKLL